MAPRGTPRTRHDVLRGRGNDRMRVFGRHHRYSQSPVVTAYVRTARSPSGSQTPALALVVPTPPCPYRSRVRPNSRSASCAFFTASSHAAPRTTASPSTSCQDSICTRNTGTLDDSVGRRGISLPPAVHRRLCASRTRQVSLHHFARGALWISLPQRGQERVLTLIITAAPWNCCSCRAQGNFRNALSWWGVTGGPVCRSLSLGLGMVGRAGLEPATPGLKARRSTR